MSLTVAGLEAEILNRVGGKWAQAQLSAVTDGTNALLNAPIRKGLRYVNLYPANPATVTDSDLSAVPPASAEAYMDACVLEALYVCQGLMANGFDQQVENERQYLHQIMTDLAAMIADYQKRVPRLNVARPVAGSLAAGAAVPNDQFRPFLGCPNPWTWPYPS